MVTLSIIYPSSNIDRNTTYNIFSLKVILVEGYDGIVELQNFSSNFEKFSRDKLLHLLYQLILIELAFC